MLLMSLVTLAAGLALRLGVDAHQRIESEGDSRQVLAVLPDVLGKQLAMVRIGPKLQTTAANTTAAAGGADKSATVVDSADSRSNPLYAFCGDGRSLSFLTAYARQGSPYQGITSVQYVYDETNRRLSVYQQIITKIEDVDGDGKTVSKRSRKKLQTFEPELVSEIENVSTFRLSYAEDPEADPADDGGWIAVWECADAISQVDTAFPGQVALTLEVGAGKGKRGGEWIFPVGYSIHIQG